jgi:hypothetical protein
VLVMLRNELQNAFKSISLIKSFKWHCIQVPCDSSSEWIRCNTLTHRIQNLISVLIYFIMHLQIYCILARCQTAYILAFCSLFCFSCILTGTYYRHTIESVWQIY